MLASFLGDARTGKDNVNPSLLSIDVFKHGSMAFPGGYIAFFE